MDFKEIHGIHTIRNPNVYNWYDRIKINQFNLYNNL